jgi:nucleoid-associated protein YgaU
MALLGVVALAYVYWIGEGPLPDAAQTSRAGDPAAPGGEAALPASPAAPAVAVTPESTPDAGIHLLPTPTPTSPADAAIAASTPRPVVIITADTFDLDRYLRENGYPHLAGLGVGARLQDTTLILRGVVQLDLQRRQLVDAVSAAPGVSEVNTVDLVLMPAPTYTVQEGETLWSIVYDVYGNAEQMQDLIDLNRDVMPSPELLSPGTVLQIPPLQ